MALHGTYGVTADGEERGALTVSPDGIRTLFSLDAEDCGEVLRLVCRGDSVSFPVGIPIPSGGRLRLQKRFSRAELRGLSGIDAAELVPLSESTVPPPAEKKPAPPEPAPVEPLSAEATPEQAIIPEPVPETVFFIPEGWREETSPAGLFADPEAAALCRDITGALSMRSGDAVLLAVPISENRPFPLSLFLCLGRPENLGGRDYIVFTVKNGVPV